MHRFVACWHRFRSAAGMSPVVPCSLDGAKRNPGFGRFDILNLIAFHPGHTCFGSWPVCRLSCAAGKASLGLLPVLCRPPVLVWDNWPGDPGLRRDTKLSGMHRTTAPTPARPRKQGRGEHTWIPGQARNNVAPPATSNLTSLPPLLRKGISAPPASE